MTYESAGHSTVADYILVRKAMKNMKAIAQKEVVTQHRLLVIRGAVKK